MGYREGGRSPILWTLLVACNEYNLDPNETDGPAPVVVAQVETFVQAPLPAVDVLFVVDGTASMDQELDALGSGVEELLGTLDGHGLDWHIGVVAADASGPWAGWLLGTPYVLTSAHPSPVQAFAERLPRGSTGGEQGLAAAVRALQEGGPTGANAGFLRADARLQVVFVSDADDHSDALLDDPTNDFLAELELAGGAQASASALVGDAPAGCTSANGSAQPGVRYFDVVRATEGQAGSICSIDFTALLQDLADGSFALPTRFTLRSGSADSVSVTVDGSPTTAWTLDGADVVFHEAPASGARIEVRYVVREAPT